SNRTLTWRSPGLLLARRQLHLRATTAVAGERHPAAVVVHRERREQDMCGEVQLDQAGATLNAALSSRVYLTGNLASPCPRCIGGSCNAGPNAGHACQAVGALGAALDCPPAPGQFIAPLNVILSPLTTGTLEKSDPSGLFCPGQSQAGAFGRTDVRRIRRRAPASSPARASS